jgi:hypothetical protein
MANDVVKTKNSDFLRTDVVSERQHPLGKQLVYPNDAVIKGSDIDNLDPQDLLISIPDLMRDRVWDSSWVRKFGLKDIRVSILLNPGMAASSYVGFADVLRVEETPEWQSLKAELDAKRVQIAEEYEQFQAENTSHNRDIEIMSERTTSANRTVKAAALRNIAAYVQGRVDAGIYISSGNIAEYLGLKPKQITELVDAGKLSRKRGVGWEYHAKSVQTYALHLAKQFEQQEG